jgi:hypothetical protein
VLFFVFDHTYASGLNATIIPETSQFANPTDSNDFDMCALDDEHSAIFYKNGNTKKGSLYIYKKAPGGIGNQSMGSIDYDSLPSTNEVSNLSIGCLTDRHIMLGYYDHDTNNSKIKLVYLYSTKEIASWGGLEIYFQIFKPVKYLLKN